MKISNYFPFGFRYPKGFPYNEGNPDPGIEAVRKRMLYLNKVHAHTNLPGHIFAAAMALFQAESKYEPDEFWDNIKKEMKMQDVARVAFHLSGAVQHEPPRLEFPNAIALFDCRFVSTKEWEHIRRYSIGGSEAAAILGVAKYHSLRSIYHEKKTPYEEKRGVDSQHILDYGHSVEPYVIAEIASRLGAKQRPEYRMFAHRQYSFITCNPDGILEFPDGSLALFEAKTAMWLKISDWKDGIPPYYAPQPRQYMEVLDDARLSKGYIGVCLGGLPKDMIAHSYERDPAAGAAQVQKIVKYWKTYIERSVLPSFSGDAKLDQSAQYDYFDMKLANLAASHPLPGEALELFEAYFDKQTQYKDLTASVNAAKAEESRILTKIREAVPEGTTICQVPNGVTYCVRAKTVQRRSVNLMEIKNRSLLAAQLLQTMAATMKGPADDWSKPKIKKTETKAKKAVRL